MHKQVEKYINRKSFQKKVKHVNNEIINSLDDVISYFGTNVFNRNKSVFSQHIIENTIPAMIEHGVTNLTANLIKLEQVTKNTLDHYKLIYNNDAEEIYNIKVEKGLQTENNFISRYGAMEGKEKWSLYSKNKSRQNTLIGYQERYGATLGEQKFNEYSNRQRYTNSIEYYFETYGDDLGEKMYLQRYPAYEYGDSYRDYKNAVYRMSQKIYDENKANINPENYPRTRMGVQDGWQLDHIKPVIECFKEGISIEDASNISNLRMLPWKENLMRNFK